MNADKSIKFFEQCVEELATCKRSYAETQHVILYNREVFTGLCKFIYQVAEKYEYSYIDAIAFDTIMHLFLSDKDREKLTKTSSKDRYDLFGAVDTRKDFLNELVRKLKKL